MKYLAIISSFMLMLCLTGCATLFGDNNKTVQVGSNPQGAQVYVNGMFVGATPTTVNISSTFSPPVIMLKKAGYQDQMTQINTNFQLVGILDILFWPTFLVDAVADNMMKIAPESRNINVNLVPYKLS